MNQEQPRKPEAGEQEPIKYGDVLDVQGTLSGHAVAPKDATMLQSAEHRTFGQVQKGGPASVMQSAATKNERAGIVVQNETTNVIGDKGVAITEIDLPGKRIITESFAGQVVGKDGGKKTSFAPRYSVYGEVGGNITIGEALEATILTAGNSPVDYSDAAAIQAAEVRATGRTNIIPGGVAAAAQSAATRNARASKDEHKTKLGEVLTDASSKLSSDKPVTRRDAEGVIGAELRNDPNLCTRPGGVSASVAAAARLNQSGHDQNK